MSSLFGNLFGKKATPVQTQPTGFETLPGQAQQGFLDLLSQTQGLPSDIFAPTPFTGTQQQALTGLQQGFAPAQERALQTLENLPGVPNLRLGQRAGETFGQAQDVFGQAQDVFGRVPGQVDLANQAVQRSLGGISRGTDPITGEQLQTGIQEFLDPFTGEVISNVSRDIRELGLSGVSDIAGAATGAGAFGGTRQALLEGELARGVGRNIGDVSARLRSQGFQSAANQALQRLTGERQRELTGAGLQLQGGQIGLGGAGALTSLGGALGGLGTQLGGFGGQLLQGRQDLRGLRTGAAEQALAAGDIRRGGLGDIFQAGEVGRQFQQAQQQSPLQQLEFLQGILGGFPAGGGGSQLRENKGALQRVVDPIATFLSSTQRRA